MQFALDQVAQLAPDEKSLAAARQSMSPRLWSGLGLTEDVVWGSCQGSARYDVAIDLKQFAHRCNCPSRKRPCRHVLGLMLLLVSHPDAVSEAMPPEGIQDWINKRRARAEKGEAASSKPVKPVDEVAQQKRVERRSERIDDGIAQLENWLCDLIRNGLASVETQGAELWEHQARRLVDAQASGLANRVRALSEIPSSSPDWPRQLLSELGRLELLLEASTRKETLPPDLQQEIRQLIGWTVSPSELEEKGESVTEEWVVIGQQEEPNDRLRVQRTWCLGKSSGRTALLLQFAPGTQPFPEFFAPASAMSATLLFYPGTARQRAKVVERADSVLFKGELPGEQSLEAILDRHSDELARNPWHDRTVAVLKSATLTRVRAEWFLRDEAGAGVPLIYREPWQILAETGGQAADFALEWNGISARPLSLGMNQALIPV